jgi:hypothetical protein
VITENKSSAKIVKTDASVNDVVDRTLKLGGQVSRKSSFFLREPQRFEEICRL